MPLAITNSVGFGARQRALENGISVGVVQTEGLSTGLTTYTFDNAAAKFNLPAPTFEAFNRSLLIAVAGTGSASRTVSSVSVTATGGSPQSATELISANASASVFAGGFYLVPQLEIVPETPTFTIDATFSGAMLGAGVAAWHIFDYDPTGTPVTGLITSGDPMVIRTVPSAGRYTFMMAGQSATTVTDILWGSGGVYASDGNDIAYTSRMFSTLAINNWSGAFTGAALGADFSSAPTNPRGMYVDLSMIPLTPHAQ